MFCKLKTFRNTKINIDALSYYENKWEIIRITTRKDIWIVTCCNVCKQDWTWLLTADNYREVRIFMWMPHYTIFIPREVP